MKKVKKHKWSFDACTGYAKRHKLFNENDMACTKTLYDELWHANLLLSPFDIPEALSHKSKKHNNTAKNKRAYGTSIEDRPDIVNSRVECGHWEIDISRT